MYKSILVDCEVSLLFYGHIIYHLYVQHIVITKCVRCLWCASSGEMMSGFPSERNRSQECTDMGVYLLQRVLEFKDKSV